MTLIELLVSLTIILIVTGAATAAYLKLLRGYKTQSKVSQSYMANLTGLEMLRYDIQMAGFGLPASLFAGTTYFEAVSDVFPTSYNPSNLNDSTTAVPRPMVTLDNTGRNGSDILAVKSSVANINTASKKWSMITMVGVTPKVKAWGGATLDATADFNDNGGGNPDQFIVLDGDGALLPALGGPWTCFAFNGSTPATGYYSNATPIASGLDNEKVYFMHGLDTSTDTHRMPFNRVDYYLDRVPAQFPRACADSTYTLYRGVINQADGKQPAANATPLIDCVRDFQVAFGLDNNGDGYVDGWVPNITGKSAATIRTEVREVRVFILYHEGTGDTGKSPDFRSTVAINLGGAGPPVLSSFTPAGKDVQYRWKVLEMAIKPMNLK